MSSETVYTKLRRLRWQAYEHPDRVFTTLAHLIDVDFLREAYRKTRKTKSSGVDRVTADQYAENLDANLTDLHQRLKTKRYKAQPVERVWLEKPDGGKRPIGIPVLEDKIVQRAVTMLLEEIYRDKFYDFSFGYRRGIRPHDALQKLREQCITNNTKWIIDADVKGVFDTIDWGHLRDFLRKHVNDGSIMRLIGKWLHAGVLEEGQLVRSDMGVPQGGSISPTLANVYLHYVLDEWFVTAVQPRMKGRVFIIRFADDFVIGCEDEEDAQRIMAVLPKRFTRFGLTIHPEKTKLIAFARPPYGDKQNRQSSSSQPGTFDFLGFTHYWARSRRGYWVIKRRTSRKRFNRTAKALWAWCRKNRHLPLPDQCRILNAKLRGHYQYYGVRNNYAQLSTILVILERAWYYWLNKRRRHPDYNWSEFRELLTKYPLPRPKIVHNI